jgi:hypothetical protein
MELEELICQHCDSQWNRAKGRGRKPKLCPTCIQSPTTIIVVQQEDDDSDSIPLIPESAPPATKFKPNSKWLCHSCGAKIKVCVGINTPPIHKCPKRANRVLPLEQI